MIARGKKTKKVFTFVVILAAVMSALKANQDLERILICLDSVSSAQLASQ
jgi:hypothetical protein